MLFNFINLWQDIFQRLRELVWPYRGFLIWGKYVEMLPLALGVLKIDGEDSGKTKMSKYMYIPVETYLIKSRSYFPKFSLVEQHL